MKRESKTQHIIKLDDADVERAVMEWMAKHHPALEIPESATWDAAIDVHESGEWGSLRGYEIVWHTITASD